VALAGHGNICPQQDMPAKTLPASPTHLNVAVVMPALAQVCSNEHTQLAPRLRQHPHLGG
jgi:hypothetical protein